MKSIFLGFVFILTQVSYSQITKNIGEFNKVTAFDKIEVLLLQSTENKIVISGNEADQVELVNKNGELKIRMPFAKTMTGEDISVQVFFIKLDAVEANEGSIINSKHIFKGLNFDIIAKEGAQIKLLLDVDRVSSKISSGAIVNLEGTAKNQEAIINAGGELEAKELVTIQTIVTTNAGGNAEVYAQDFVDAKTRAGGSILLYGNPKQLNQKTVAGGTIIKK